MRCVLAKIIKRDDFVMTFPKRHRQNRPKNKSPATETVAGLCFISERATGLEPATSSLGSWHSTN
jgi:hypothetical protein